MPPIASRGETVSPSADLEEPAPPKATPEEPAPLADLPDELIADETESGESTHVPVFGTWGRWYAVVLGNLLLLIILFYWFTKAYA